MIKFLKPEFLILLPIVLGLSAIYIFFRLRDKFKIKRLWENSKLGHISRFSSSGREILTHCLLFLMLASIILAISQPQIPYEKQMRTKKSLDIVCLVDLSRSMNTEDVLFLGKRVVRLELVKEELRNFVENYIGKEKDQMALIAFGLSAIYRSYFTYDVESLLFQIDCLDTGDFPPEGTDIGAAILRGLEMLDIINKKSEVFKRPKYKRVFILISDGEDLGESLDLAIEEVRKKRIPVYTIGVGSKRGGKVIEEIDENGNKVYMKEEDKNGNEVVILSKLEEKILKKIARSTNGKYVRSTSGQELTEAFEDIIERETGRERKTEKAYHDIWWHLFLSAFVLCLLIIILKKN